MSPAWEASRAALIVGYSLGTRSVAAIAGVPVTPAQMSALIAKRSAFFGLTPRWSAGDAEVAVIGPTGTEVLACAILATVAEFQHAAGSRMQNDGQVGSGCGPGRRRLESPRACRA